MMNKKEDNAAKKQNGKKKNINEEKKVAEEAKKTEEEKKLPLKSPVPPEKEKESKEHRYLLFSHMAKMLLLIEAICLSL